MCEAGDGRSNPAIDFFDTRVEYILRVDYLVSAGTFVLLEIISSKFTIILPGTVPC